ncbi:MULTISPECIES: hypothetical protein [unclassified Acinetobacter]|uniref:hypothetical protein n=1 Tax=unclassified Acinetobacter TaxID=196816 RepID=UPI0025B8E83D|nr:MULTISPECIES: hypothetical protein [unclassified Acinetobacter]
MSGLNNKQNEQNSACSCASNDLLVELIKQNNQLIQINNEQNAQINELLIQLTEDDDEPKRSGYLDDQI